MNINPSLSQSGGLVFFIFVKLTHYSLRVFLFSIKKILFYLHMSQKSSTFAVVNIKIDLPMKHI